ncbi:MAG: TonB-dependent receptor plug domain-containing protein, partial [Methylobacterium sp.]
MRALILAGTSLAALTAARAQEATPRAGASVQLDEISVESRGAGGVTGPVAGGASIGSPTGVEDPRGPVAGYVATRSATATKTNTRLVETPQSITVVGRKQIDSQNAQTLTQATQYVAGAFSGSFGFDTRNTFIYLRGFNVSDYGIYRDGLQTLNYGFGYFNVNTFGLERIEILRGPAAVLFGAGSPGGIVNQVSKRPTTEPFG